MRLVLSVVLLSLAWSVIAATPASEARRENRGLRRIESTDTTLISTRHTNGAIKPLAPGPDDSRIARIASTILESHHYNRQPFDDAVSGKFLDRYLDALDPAHLVFLQSDIQEFDQWRTLLDEMTLKTGDTSPAEKIFNRFIKRFSQQVEYATNLVQAERFDFTGNDRYSFNRKDAPRPANLAEARRLWRDRVRYEYLQEKLNKEKPEEITKIISRRYARQLRTLSDFDSDDVFQIYLTSLAHVYDPHSDYMGKPSLDNFNISMKLSLFGIGALLRSEDGYCKIQELMDGPAKKSGQVKPNDKIIAVGQGTNAPVEVVDEPLKKVVELIRGPKGTEVRLTVVPVEAADPSNRKIVSLIRDEIKLEDQEAKAKIIEMPGENSTAKPRRLGMIDLPSFYADLESRQANRKSTTTDVAKLLKKLKEENVEGVILDLRRNGGGSLEEAINLTGLFIKEGPVVQVKDSRGDRNVDSDTDPDIAYDGPLIVLTSRFSASASEILAGALQDYGRALIVGDSSTHGKGTVQTLLNLGPLIRSTNNLGALKITIRKFYRASGSSTQLKGVVPDIILPSINNHAEIGEASLPNALPWDTVPAAKYEPVNAIPPVLPELRKRSEARVTSDKDFAFIREEIERFKKMKEEKSVSMNEELRWKEKKENEARAEARKQELRSRPDPGYKTYEITLKTADQPGLPAPLARTNLLAEARNKPTNTVAKASTPKADDEDEAKEDATPSVDITLDEGWRILQDLVALTSKDRALAGRPQSRPDL